MADELPRYSTSRTMWRQVRGLAMTGQLRLTGIRPRMAAGLGMARLVGAAESQQQALVDEAVYQLAILDFESEGGPTRPEAAGPQPPHSQIVRDALHAQAISAYVRR